ncbi:MAG: DEAD/DEAH box helicase family protein [Kiritimatiellae bacterium]|nr:DEAD/DEAH box helicase family protein [Kiritimatiellia bacterium]
MGGKSFFDDPILNSPYEYPSRHWEMDADNRPTGVVVERRRESSNRTPIASPRSKGKDAEFLQGDLFNEVVDDIAYRENALINAIRDEVAAWRNSPESNWNVTAETTRLLKHWRHFDFPSYKPFFCQVEAVETLIWLIEVAPATKAGKNFLARIADANAESDPDLYRIALKLATGAGKTTVMAMIVAWQTINANRHGVGDKFTNGFLITTPGITIRDRLRVLLPNDPNSYYRERQLVPMDLLPLMNSARIVITNYHAYELKNTLDLSAGTKAMLAGPTGAGPQTVETPGQMLQRVMKELVGLKNILMINDEAHHCYRHRPNDDGERPLDADEKEEAMRNAEAARVWIRGLETVRAHIGKDNMRPKVIDLSATPFFLRGSGYQEGTLFPWTVSDFSLMDALECGIVKLPRIPIDDNISPLSELPKYRELWKNICEQDKSFRSLRGKSKSGSYDPQKIPNLLQTAIMVLYKGYEDTFNRWSEAGIKTPPCFVFVCQNTVISKLVYDFISGYVTTDANGDEHSIKGKCPLFSNFDDSGQPLARPNTLLIDSMQLESGGALSPDFRIAAAKEIEVYKRELIARTGDRQAADKLDDAALLREVMNTVGKEGQLGGSIRCVVSVAMLTEGWDANTVTHILGVRAFGTQLLCEQVVGRALRRLNYETDATTGLYRPEYADIFGIPFDFASSPGSHPPIEPPDIVHVHAVHPDRDSLSIQFPRVMGYYLDPGNADIHLTAKFNEGSELRVTPKDIGPTAVLNAAFVGRREKLVLGEGTMRVSEVVAQLTKHFIGLFFAMDKFTDMDRTQLFIQVRRLFTQWINGGYLKLDPTVNNDCVVAYKNLADAACQRVNLAIMRAEGEKGLAGVRAIIDNFMPTGSTSRVNFRISRNSRTLFETDETRSHVNYAVCDSSWEAIFCSVVETHPRTLCYVKNFNLGFEVPYVLGTESKMYLPDFIVLVDDGKGKDDPLHLVVEVKGYRYLDADIKKQTMQDMWIPGVNAEKSFGRWAFVELNEKDFLMDGLASEESLRENCRKAYGKAVEDILGASGETVKGI